MPNQNHTLGSEDTLEYLDYLYHEKYIHIGVNPSFLEALGLMITDDWAAVPSNGGIPEQSITTSHIESTSGIKYYIIFLHDFAHYVYVYPLHTKYDVFDKFVHFHAFVKSHFQTEIKTFQCQSGANIITKKFINFVI